MRYCRGMENGTNPAGTGADARVARRVLELYAEGWFPMGEGREGPVEWVQPEMRSVLELAPGHLHVPKTLASRVRSGRFEIRADTAFGRVIRACAAARTSRGEVDDDSWITGEIVELYERLARAGVAHSIEAWRDGALVGGLYGVSVGGVFCGESMFSRPKEGGTDASKVCLVHLVGHLRRMGYGLLDAQIANHHTAQFGFEEKSAAWYLARLAGLAGGPGMSWGVFDAAAALEHVPEVAAGRYTGP